MQDILEYFKENPAWLAGFASGEGSFSAYAYADLANTWGIQYGIDFSVSQNGGDRVILEATNAYFNNEGGVYDRTCNVSCVTFRNLTTLQSQIIPFFSKHPLIGSKHLEFERWSVLVETYLRKEHIGTTLKQRDAFLSVARARATHPLLAGDAI
jgi:hypothetical protein